MRSNYQINIQNNSQSKKIPSNYLMRKWATCALENNREKTELTLRFVDEAEISVLNKQYRKKNYATNVLSFPCELPADVNLTFPYLGDIVICPAVVNAEAKEQNKKPNAHWAHMVIHGVLHLLGYDHEIDSEAEKMESIEIELLQKLKIANPYIWSEN